LRMTSLSSHTAINKCRKNRAAKHSVNTARTQHQQKQNKDYESQHTKITTLPHYWKRQTRSHTWAVQSATMEAQKKTSKQGHRKQELHSSCWEQFGEQNKSKLTQDWEYSFQMSRQFYLMSRRHGEVHRRQFKTHKEEYRPMKFIYIFFLEQGRVFYSDHWVNIKKAERN
jgi:hypothetical protein